METWIETYLNHAKVDFFNPDPDTIFIEDIDSTPAAVIGVIYN